MKKLILTAVLLLASCENRTSGDGYTMYRFQKEGHDWISWKEASSNALLNVEHDPDCKKCNK
jgi:hypothetical protein